MATESVKPSADFSSIVKELEKLVKKWESVSKSQEKATKSAEKFLDKLESTTKTVADLSKSVGSAVKGFQSIIDSQQKMASQVESTTAAIQKQKNVLADTARSNAKYAGDLVQRGLTQKIVTNKGATPAEQTAYKNAIGRLKEIVGQHDIAREHIQKIWNQLGKGETEAYTGALRKVRNALVDVKDAQEKLGAAAQKVAAAEKDAQAQEAARVQKLEAQNRAVAQQEALLKRRAAAAKAADSATSLLLQKGVSQAEIARLQATPTEVLNYKNAITRVRELRNAHDIAYRQMSQMWQDIGQNKIKSYLGGLSDIQTAMLKVKAAQSQLGASFQKQIDAQTAAFMQQATIHAKNQAAVKQMKSAVDELTLSWKSMVRLFAVQLIHQAVSSVIRTIREGIGTVIELGIRIGEVQTISQKLPLSVNQWIDGFRKLSDTWGGPILDQVAAGYEAISDQIVEGAETFRYLAEVNQFAVTSVSSAQEAVQLLDATINAFKLDTSRANEIAASFFATIDLGRVKASEMAQTFGQLAVPAAQLGLKLNELQSMITVASRQGIKYNTTATYLRNVFLKLIKPTEEMQRWFHEIGVESGQAAIQTYGWINLLTLMDEKFGDNTAEIGKFMGRLRAIQGTMSITGKSLQEVKDDFVEIGNSVKTYNEKVKLIQETPEKKLSIIMDRIKNFFTVDVGKGLIDTLESTGVNFNKITVAVKAFADTLVRVAIPAVGGLIALLSTINPILAGITGLGFFSFWIQARRRMDQENADEIDRQTAANQKAWLDREILNINTAYDAAIKSHEKASQQRLELLATERGLIQKSIVEYEEPYEHFLESTKRLEEKIIDSIKDRLSETKEEINRLSDIAKKKAKDFNKEMDVANYIMERRFSGKDRPDLKEPDLYEKFRTTATQVSLLEEQMRKAARETNKERFEAIRTELEKTVKEQITLSDQLREANRFAPIKSGESYYRFWIEEGERQKRVMQETAAARLKDAKNNQQYLEDEISRVKDLAKVIRDTSWTDISKMEDPERFKDVMTAQQEAFQRMQEYASRYGTDFYREAQMALEKSQVNELIYLKNRDTQLKAQQEVDLAVAKRQTDEINRNREIWVQYVAGARNASNEVRGILNELVKDQVTMNRQGQPRYASGRSAGIDTQAAWLSPQEMVMNPNASRKFYSQLVAMNSGARRFSSGGTTYNFGDMNFNGISQNAETNIIKLGKGLKKQIRLGRLDLGN